MSVKIRLTRFGAKKNPYYRVMAIDERSRRDGRCLEWLGYYHPKKNPSAVNLNMARVDYWLGVGAQPSDTVKRIIAEAKTGAAQTQAQPA